MHAVKRESGVAGAARRALGEERVARDWFCLAGTELRRMGTTERVAGIGSRRAVI
jgi:hypothetical protein